MRPWRVSVHTGNAALHSCTSFTVPSGVRRTLLMPLKTLQCMLLAKFRFMSDLGNAWRRVAGWIGSDIISQSHISGIEFNLPYQGM